MYEEAIETVVTVRDFTQVFDAYAQFSETMISSKMEDTAEQGPTDDGMRRGKNVLPIYVILVTFCPNNVSFAVIRKLA